MGLGVHRFEGHVDDDLICFLCKDVLHNPLEISCCGQLFCEKCIKPMIAINKKCPADEKPVIDSDLKPPSSVIYKLLSKMRIKCDFEAIGCQCVQRLNELEAHVKECPFNSALTIECPEKCGASLRRDNVDDEFPEHSCISFMISVIKESTDDNRFHGLLNVIEKQHQESLMLMKRISEIEEQLKRLPEMELKKLKESNARITLGPEVIAELNVKNETATGQTVEAEGTGKAAKLNPLLPQGITFIWSFLIIVVVATNVAFLASNLEDMRLIKRAPELNLQLQQLREDMKRLPEMEKAIRGIAETMQRFPEMEETIQRVPEIEAKINELNKFNEMLSLIPEVVEELNLLKLRQEISTKHVNLVNKLKAKGIVKSDNVYRTLLSLDFMEIPDRSYALKDLAKYLEEIAPHLMQGMRVWNGLRSPYMSACLSLMVGPRGSVVGFTGDPSAEKSLRSQAKYAFLFGPHIQRLALQYEWTECPLSGSGQYDLITNSYFVSSSKSCKAYLKPGGKLFSSYDISVYSWDKNLNRLIVETS